MTCKCLQGASRDSSLDTAAVPHVTRELYLTSVLLNTRICMGQAVSPLDGLESGLCHCFEGGGKKKTLCFQNLPWVDPIFVPKHKRARYR